MEAPGCEPAVLAGAASPLTSTTRGVAVVLPVYNHADYVGEAIHSVFSQTQLPQRLVIIDDGSSDGSLAAVERALAEMPPPQGLAVELRRQQNRGSGRTFNDAIAALDEPLIALLNSDDRWAPRRLELLLPHLQAGTPGLVFSAVTFIGDLLHPDARRYGERLASILSHSRALPSIGFALLRMNLAISSGNFVFTRRLFELIGGFDDAILTCQDWGFLLQCLRVVEPVVVPEPLYHYRFHDSNSYRLQSDHGEADLEAILFRWMTWARRPCPNRLAPTPGNFPRLFPFFLPHCRDSQGWQRLLVPELLALVRAAKPEAFGGDELGREAVERQALQHCVRRLRKASTSSQALEAQRIEPPRDPLELLRESADHWARVRHGEQRPKPAMAALPLLALAAAFHWGGATVTVATEEPRLLDELSAFTGLPQRRVAVALGRADLNVVGDGEVFVRGQLRRFTTPADRLIWLVLTLGEFLASGTRPPILHAAAVELDGVAVLFTGEPYAGKSTLTLEALAQGYRVLGDDQVRLEPGGHRVQPLPRPVKLRIAPEDPLPAGLAHQQQPLRGWLEQEGALMLRRGPATVAPEAWLPVAAVVHMERTEQPGVSLQPLTPAAVQPALQRQLRGSALEETDPFTGSCSGIAALPQLRLAVGVDCSGEALRRVIALLRCERTS